MLIRFAFLAGVSALIAPLGGRAHAPVASAEHLQIVVSIAPLTSLIEPMAPAGTVVHTLARSGGSPHGAEYSPSVLARALGADLLVYTSASAEPGVARIAALRRAAGAPSLSLTDVPGDALDLSHDHVDHHPPHRGDAEEHPWIDSAIIEAAIPHWADQVRALLHDHGVLDDARSRAIDLGAERAVQTVREVRAAFRAVLPALANRPIVSLHGALDAVLRDAGLDPLPPLLIGHATDPTAGAVDRLARLAAIAPGVILLLDAPAEPAIVARLGAVPGVRVARTPVLGDRDWEHMMRETLRAMLEAVLTP